MVTFINSKVDPGYAARSATLTRGLPLDGGASNPKSSLQHRTNHDSSSQSAGAQTCRRDARHQPHRHRLQHDVQRGRDVHRRILKVLSTADIKRSRLVHQLEPSRIPCRRSSARRVRGLRAGPPDRKHLLERSRSDYTRRDASGELFPSVGDGGSRLCSAASRRSRSLRAFGPSSRSSCSLALRGWWPGSGRWSGQFCANAQQGSRH